MENPNVESLFRLNLSTPKHLAISLISKLLIQILKAEFN